MIGKVELGTFLFNFLKIVRWWVVNHSINAHVPCHCNSLHLHHQFRNSIISYKHIQKGVVCKYTWPLQHHHFSFLMMSHLSLQWLPEVGGPFGHREANRQVHLSWKGASMPSTSFASSWRRKHLCKFLVAKNSVNNKWCNTKHQHCCFHKIFKLVLAAMKNFCFQHNLVQLGNCMSAFKSRESTDTVLSFMFLVCREKIFIKTAAILSCQGWELYSKG